MSDEEPAPASDEPGVALTPVRALATVVLIVILIVMWRARRAC